MVLARWDLVPFFTKDPNDVKGLSTINARSETMTKGPTWREPFQETTLSDARQLLFGVAEGREATETTVCKSS
jgi:hypothetical protein